MYRVFVLMFYALLLTACTAQPTPTLVPTSTPILTASPIPSSTPTLTATPQVVQLLTPQFSTGSAAKVSTVDLSRLPTITPRGSPQTKSPDASGNLTMTLDDNGIIIALKVGQRFLLNLGDGYEWDVQIADQNIVNRVVNIVVVRGAQGVYQANKVGRTTLNAVGDPPCRRVRPPCMLPSRLFTIDIVVQ